MQPWTSQDNAQPDSLKLLQSRAGAPMRLLSQISSVISILQSVQLSVLILF